jgi:uncharacterized protein
MISDADGQKIIQLARESIITKFSNSKPESTGLDHLTGTQGIFVTLHKKGELRGCVGYIESEKLLKNSIIEIARSAAFNDSRFSAVTEDEMKEIDLEVSILSIPKEVKIKKPEDYFDHIKIGQHGLILQNGMHSGLLLPQVPVEQKWDKKEYLTYLGIKAGIGPDAWKDKNTKIYAFEAQVFHEEQNK